ncbi:MAG: ABC-2 type transport system permease protein [Roseivirga sp.]|jgi:ABC-2 type transport system permease protein
MIRLLKIELKKVMPSTAFKVLAIMYIIAMVIVSVGVMPFFQYLRNKFADFDLDGIDPTIIPFYEFPDIWQNLTSVMIWFKMLLGFSLIFSITNEYSYRTIRQNVIDGLTKHEFIWSKIIMAGFLSAISTVALFVLGLITGLIYSSDITFVSIFSDVYFLIAFFFQLLAFLLFTLFVGTLIRKSIIAMGVLIFWVLAVENGFYVWSKVKNLDWVEYLLPVKSINALIHNPFPKYAFQEIQDYVALPEMGLVILWAGLFYWATTKLVVGRDL